MPATCDFPCSFVCVYSKQIVPQLAREMFNAAFVSCWSKLRPSYQEHLVVALETVFRADAVPTDILTMLLNLAEFMEHDDKSLPIDTRMLGAYTFHDVSE